MVIGLLMVLCGVDTRIHRRLDTQLPRFFGSGKQLASEWRRSGSV